MTMRGLAGDIGGTETRLQISACENGAYRRVLTQPLGYGVGARGGEYRVGWRRGEPVEHGPRAVIGAGTGLGQGILIWNRDHYEPVATEGGHANFAPVNERQIELTRYLLKTVGR